MSIYEILALIGIPSILTLIFQLLYTSIRNKLKKNKDDDDILRKSIQALLRDRLRERYVYFKSKGYIDIADKENYDNMYKNYHALGKNGVMDGMYEEIMSMPMISPENKETN